MRSVPSHDCGEFKDFYLVFGWCEVWTDGDALAILELADHRVLLQDFYLTDWANNFIITIAGADAAA